MCFLSFIFKAIVVDLSQFYVLFILPTKFVKIAERMFRYDHDKKPIRAGFN